MKNDKYILLLIIVVFISTLAYGQNKSFKRGLGYGYHSEQDMKTISQGISWWYNWYVLPDNQVAEIYKDYDMEFVPMVWNNNSDTANLKNYLLEHPDVKYILGFNEPNFTAQANMTPSVAANSWSMIESIADEFGLEIVGPAVNYCGTCVTENEVTFYDPFEYLDSFFVKCADCRVDYIAIHNYMCYKSALEWYIGEFYKYEKKIWLTEFACWESGLPSNAKFQQNYMMDALDLLEHDTMIFRYAWFYGRTTSNISGYPYHSVFNSDPGSLTKLGEIYVNYNPIHDTNIYAAVPAKLEAEHYNNMFGIDVEITDDKEGMMHVTDVSTDDWLEYNIDVPDSGSYKIYLRRRGVLEGQVKLLLDKDSIGNFESYSKENDTKIWYTDSLEVIIDTGFHTIRLEALISGYKFNWIYVSDSSLKFEDFNSDPEILKRVNKETINNGIKIYPNPTTDGIFTIELVQNNYNSDLHIEIMDISGRIILAKKVTPIHNKIRIDLNNETDIVKGIYFIRLYTNTENWTSKILFN